MAVRPAAKQVVLVTHESFFLPKKLVKAFEQESGYDLVLRASGDAGTMTNKLVLSAGNPQGDVAFGVDNTFASRALDNDVFAPYAATLPAGAETYALPGDDDHRLTPVDNANVCVNIDTTWFDAEGIAPPETFEDLVDPTYRDLFVLPGAASSSPGMAFLLATIAEYGDDWPTYWTDLMDNGAKLTSGWSGAYEVDFTQGGGQGDRPIVLSYDSSPAFTVGDERQHHQGAARHLLPPGRVRRGARGRREPRGRRGGGRLAAVARGAGRPADEHVRLPGRPGDRAAG